MRCTLIAVLFIVAILAHNTVSAQNADVLVAIAEVPTIQVSTEAERGRRRSGKPRSGPC